MERGREIWGARSNRENVSIASRRTEAHALRPGFVAEHDAGLPDLLGQAAQGERGQVLLHARFVAEVRLVEVGGEGEDVRAEAPLEVEGRAAGAGGGEVEVVLVLLLEEKVAVLAHVQGGPELPRQHLESVPVEVVVEGLVGLRADDVGPERPARGLLGRIAELVAEAPADLRVVVGVEGLVEAPAHGPEEAGADLVALGRGMPDVGEEKPGRALVLSDRVVEIGKVEARERT